MFEKKIYKNAPLFLQFIGFLSFEERSVFYFCNLFLRMLCAKFGWNWPGGFRENVKITDGRTDRWAKYNTWITLVSHLFFRTHYTTTFETFSSFLYGYDSEWRTQLISEIITGFDVGFCRVITSSFIYVI